MAIPPALKDACRWVCFETDVEDWEVATHGGTLFVVVYMGVPYGLTAKHNQHSFAWKNLIVTKDRLSNQTAGLKAVSYAGAGLGSAAGSDLLDVAIIQFADDVTPDYFDGSAYDLDTEPVCASQSGDDLTIYGVLTAPSILEEKQIIPKFGELGFLDVGPNSHDPVLREARGQWLNSKVHDLGGLSGGPVYNATQEGLCGMILRGGIAVETGIATGHFIEIMDIARVLHSVHEGSRGGSYAKIVTRLKT